MPEMEAEGGVVRVAAARPWMIRVIERFGEWAHGGRPFLTASEWEGYGFEAEEAEEYLGAGVYEPSEAAGMRAAGITGVNAARPLSWFEDLIREGRDWQGECRRERLLSEHGRSTVAYLWSVQEVSRVGLAALVRGEEIEV